MFLMILMIMSHHWISDDLVPSGKKPLPGARPTNDISIEFAIRQKYVVLWFIKYSTYHN